MGAARTFNRQRLVADLVVLPLVVLSAGAVLDPPRPASEASLTYVTARWDSCRLERRGRWDYMIVLGVDGAARWFDPPWKHYRGQPCPPLPAEGDRTITLGYVPYTKFDRIIRVVPDPGLWLEPSKWPHGMAWSLKNKDDVGLSYTESLSGFRGFPEWLMYTILLVTLAGYFPMRLIDVAADLKAGLGDRDSR